MGASVDDVTGGTVARTCRSDIVRGPVPAPQTLTPRAVLQAILEDVWERLTPHLAAAASLFGAMRAAASAVAVTARSTSVARASARAAIRALAMPVSRAADTPAAEEPVLNSLVDAWLAETVLVTCRATGAVPVPDLETRIRELSRTWMGPYVRPRSAANEFGALTARIQRVRPRWVFAALHGALEAVAAKDRRRGPAAHRSPRGPVWPREILAWLVAHPPGNDFELARNAALAIGAALGLPITLARLIETDHVTLMKDSDRSTGLMLAVPPRESGIKVQRRRQVVQTDEGTRWTGAAGPLIDGHFAPWYRRARAAGCRYVFPKFHHQRRTEFDRAQVCSERMFSQAIKDVREDGSAQWHDMRRGLEHALEAAHKVPGVASPIPADVKNAVMLRSNLAQRGSRDTYIHDSADQLFAATRHAHKVQSQLVRGLIVDGSDGITAADEGDLQFDASCAWCETFLSAEEGEGWLCDEPSCLWTVCTACFPDGATQTLYCPAHEGADDAASEDNDSDADASDDDT